MQTCRYKKNACSERQHTQHDQKTQVEWFGYVNRREETSMLKKAHKEELQGKTGNGRPKKKVSDQIREVFGVPLLTIERRTQDKDKWKENVTRKCARVCLELRIQVN